MEKSCILSTAQLSSSFELRAFLGPAACGDGPALAPRACWPLGVVLGVEGCGGLDGGVDCWGWAGDLTACAGDWEGERTLHVSLAFLASLRNWVNSSCTQELRDPRLSLYRYQFLRSPPASNPSLIQGFT